LQHVYIYIYIIYIFLFLFHFSIQSRSMMDDLLSQVLSSQLSETPRFLLGIFASLMLSNSLFHLNHIATYRYFGIHNYGSGKHRERCLWPCPRSMGFPIPTMQSRICGRDGHRRTLIVRCVASRDISKPVCFETRDGEVCWRTRDHDPTNLTITDI